jgi:uncharacterized protein (TIGR02145 family)
MKTKIYTLLLLIAFPFASLQAQDYLISFAGSGASTAVSSIKVENLTQGTYLEIDGIDVLHLVNNITGIEQVKLDNVNQISFSPNPMNDYTRMQFNLPEDGQVFINLFDVSGRNLLQTNDYLFKGQHTYRIQGVTDGIYVVSIRSKEYSSSGRFISSSQSHGRIKINYENTVTAQLKKNIKKDQELNEFTKGTSSEIFMQYNSGDRLKFTAITGNYKTVITDIPTQSKSLTFNFLPCSDLDGREYSVVAIGSQTWMAENLAYLPAVSPYWIVSITDMHYYVYAYNGTDVAEAKTTNYYNSKGVLYNWAAVMQGASGSKDNLNRVKGVCPAEWHLPSDAEWLVLIDYLGGEMIAGGKMKSVTGWPSPNSGADNSSGFSGLPGGYVVWDGHFGDGAYGGHWWSSTEKSSTEAWGQSLYYGNINSIWFSWRKEYGFSIRCIKD